MPERLSFPNFFNQFYLLEHDHPQLDQNDHRKTLYFSIALGILTLGTVHGICALIRCIQSSRVKPIESSEVDDKTVTKTKNIGKSLEPEKAAPTKNVAAPRTNLSIEQMKEEMGNRLDEMCEQKKGMEVAKFIEDLFIQSENIDRKQEMTASHFLWQQLQGKLNQLRVHPQHYKEEIINKYVKHCNLSDNSIQIFYQKLFG